MATEYYQPIDIIDKTNPLGGSWAALWRHVKDGVEIEVVDLAGKPVALPAVYEAHLTSTDEHFAPGVLRDPNPPPLTTVAFADLVTAIRAAQAVVAAQPAQAAPAG